MRAYEEFVGLLIGLLSLRLLLLILVGGTALWAAAWYWYPAWIPRRLPRFRFRFRLPRLKKRTRKARHGRTEKPPEKAKRGRKPVPAAAPTDLADRLAAEGRYDEAIRQRLRDTVTDLTHAGVVTPEPGTTAAEITAEAAAGRPAVETALTGATGLFSRVWYGRQRAGASDDERMRHLTAEVREALRSGERR
ncbi:DUF4129 domain-containing protein [Actinoplanes utahensis]|uniref:Protein-glutamine gamma-glutamyltransferase-like C-terminal domain-containing protein n=1 Tax=Actinoplanes utahensis TaxID=1869 RepID=A0A0A6UEL2_ACTUT|nr:DUF4129 domain-containing protein [Actinoplanes utahensis]KHD73518.1 hypothetical protein MB27_33730 [Actinoplanes utahensis]GIF33824.1 hypothetical protein Aut01nite_68100 [Actinoplanes utahensis]